MKSLTIIEGSLISTFDKENISLILWVNWLYVLRWVWDLCLIKVYVWKGFLFGLLNFIVEAKVGFAGVLLLKLGFTLLFPSYPSKMMRL